MPKKIPVYDRETGDTIYRFPLAAKECCVNGEGRFSLSPWKTPPKVSEKDRKAAANAAKEAKAKPQVDESSDQPQPGAGDSPEPSQDETAET